MISNFKTRILAMQADIASGNIKYQLA